MSLMTGHDIQQNDNKQNDIQQNNTKHSNNKFITEHYFILHNCTQKNYSLHKKYDTEHNETKTNYMLTTISRMTLSKMTFCISFTNSTLSIIAFYITAISKMTLCIKNMTLSTMRLRLTICNDNKQNDIGQNDILQIIYKFNSWHNYILHNCTQQNDPLHKNMTLSIIRLRLTTG